MKHHVSPDLIQDHPIAVFFTFVGIALGEVVEVRVAVLWVALGLFLLNAATTFVFTYKRTNDINGELVVATVLRVYAYGAGAIVVVGLSIVFPAVAGPLQEVVFRGAAGVEGLVTLGMIARMLPRVRPMYRYAMEKLDAALPFDFGSKEVSAILDRYDSDPEDGGAGG